MCSETAGTRATTWRLYTVFHYCDKISKETKQNKEEELRLALFQML